MFFRLIILLTIFYVLVYLTYNKFYDLVLIASCFLFRYTKCIFVVFIPKYKKYISKLKQSILFIVMKDIINNAKTEL